MLNRISSNVKNYFIALTVLVVCAISYRAASEQLLKVPTVMEVAPRPPTERVELKTALADLFPADAWQLGDCKRLLTSNGALLFQNWRQISEDQWKLEPLTIVVGRGLSDEAAQTPIVLTAPEGAEIQFAQSLDMMGGSAPPIKMGRMIGDVLIERSGDLQPRDELSVTTRNVRIDMQKVWTTEKISMKIAGAELRGSDLTIYLAASATTATKAKAPSAVLDRMDLVYLEELRIPLDRPHSRTNPAQATAMAGLPRRIGANQDEPENGVVSIRCNGGLVYDFALDRLSLRDKITMDRTVREVMLDRFRCDTLDMVLRNPADRNIQRTSPLDWIDRIQVTGRPAIMEMQSYDVSITAGEIVLDAIGGLLTAKGDDHIQIQRGPFYANLNSLAYQYDPAAPETIGVVDVHGAGTIAVSDPSIMLKQFQWTDGFKLESIGQATVTAVREKREQSKLRFQVDGNVQAKLSDGGVAAAGSIEGILKPHYVDTRVDLAWSDAMPGRIKEPSERFEREMTFVPEVLHAFDAVSMNSNQIVANMDRLSLFFEQSADFRNQTTHTANEGILALSGNSDSAQTRQPGLLAGWVQQPESTDGPRPPVARPRPKLSGRTVSALLLVTPDGIQTKDLSIDGDVHVEHQFSAGERMMPIELTGQRMRLSLNSVAQASGQDFLQIGSGPDAPARLTMDDGFFTGPIIKVFPSENVVQVAGAGELKIPSALMVSAKPTDTNDVESSQPLALSRIHWNAPPHCRWAGSMQFNGQTALLSGGVNIDAEFINGTDPWITTMNGDEMQISLRSAVNLMDRNSLRSAQLANISILQTGSEPVMVRARQNGPEQNPESIHIIAASRLDYLPAESGQSNGGLLGTGPGWYRGWMLMDEKNSLLPQAANTPTRAEHSTRSASRVLQGVHLTFRETMRCDLGNQSIGFTGGVRTGVKKLQSWDEMVDVTQMQRLAIDEMTMDCQQLKFGITPGMPEDLRRIPGMPTPWEMVAEGGIVVRSMTEKQGLIEATASRASFESKKSWLNVEGAPGRNAFIRQSLPDGKPGFQTESPRMLLNLKTFEFQTVMQNAQINNITLPQ